jgi:hypothetical protein
MQMHAIATELGPDWSGPYTDIALANRILDIVRWLDPEAEIISQETDPYRGQIEAGLSPYEVFVHLDDEGKPQLPATVTITWPPADIEGIQHGNTAYQQYFVWALNEKDALLRLARLNKATPKAKAEAEA